MKRKGLIFLFLIIGLTSYSQNYDSFEELKNRIISKTIPLISAEDLKKIANTKKPFLILDAREAKEFKVSHIERAKHVGYNKFKISKLKKVDKSTTIVVYCSVGYRSEKVGEKLKKAGFKKVMNLQGGIFEWKNQGYSVYDKEEKETKKIHAYSKEWGKWLIKGEKVYE